MWLAICMMIDDEMYGMMPSANMPKRSSAPPENRLNSAEQVAGCCVEEVLQRDRIHAGHGNERADAEHDQRTDQEQDPSLQFASLLACFRDIRRILLGLFRHVSLPFEIS